MIIQSRLDNPSDPNDRFILTDSDLPNIEERLEEMRRVFVPG